MLTVSAAGPPLLQHFYRPEDEMWMVVVILDTQDYDDRLICSTDEAPRYVGQWMGALENAPAP